MLDKHIIMLKELSKRKIFKFKTVIGDKNSELNVIFKDHSDKEVLDFLNKLNKEKYLISESEIKKRKTTKNNYITVCIDWMKIFEENILGENDSMFKFYLKYPITFAVSESKSRYLMNLEYYEFEQPASLINSLDSLFIMYFVNNDKFEKVIGQNDEKIIIDLYTNLYSYTNTIPMKSDNLYELDTYERVLRESNITIDKKLLSELYKAKDLTKDNIVKQYKKIESQKFI